MTSTSSGPPLFQKLGIKFGVRLRLIDPPSDVEALLSLPFEVQTCEHDADVVLWFVTREQDLRESLSHALGTRADRGALWIAWPKRASKVPTDIREDLLREVVLPTGLVDNKVCSISEVWSGLRFVARRPK